VTTSHENLKKFRQLQLSSNRGRGAGSAAMAAFAMASEGMFEPEVNAKILEIDAKGGKLPASFRRASAQVSGAMIARYRDPKKGQGILDGADAHGWLRRDEATGRRLFPGERQVWDDMTSNLYLHVPWPDSPHGVRLARYQLLFGIDCATNFPIGYSLVCRENDAYRSEDVCCAWVKAWTRMGHRPEQIVLEGGAWQSNLTLEFLRLAGVKPINAKGRAKQKLVEGYFNSLQTMMTIVNERGNVGRFRGEMSKETGLALDCQAGRKDPRNYFLSVDEYIQVLHKSVDILAMRTIKSNAYGTLPAPIEAFRGFKPLPLRGELWRYILPETRNLTILPRGCVKTKALAPNGLKHEYWFHAPELHEFAGAPATVQFDAYDIRRGAVISLAKDWRMRRAGEIITTQASCTSNAADIFAPRGFFDNRPATRKVASASRRLIIDGVADLDTRKFGNAFTAARIAAADWTQPQIETAEPFLIEPPAHNPIPYNQDYGAEPVEKYDIEAAERLAGVY
jgi:hypothetical protein